MWQELDKGNAVYLHRIVVNPAFKGKKLFGVILDWSIAHAKEKGIPFVRMDTWANNPNIIEYYKGFGFTFIRNYNTGENMNLPVHNRNIIVALLEYKIK
jgi:ribosomal protein S18 acetylase RimI-like enzyme